MKEGATFWLESFWCAVESPYVYVPQSDLCFFRVKMVWTWSWTSRSTLNSPS